MQEDKISVIVPIYMGEQWLERCVKSIINQSYRNLEIILVDDGSPDASGAICDKLQKEDARIKVVHKENGGLSDARNAGIDVAGGTYIMYVDEDDYIHPQTIEIMHRVITETASDIAVFDFQMIPDRMVDEFPPITKIKEPVCYEGQDIMNQLWYRNLRTVVAWDKIYKRSIYDHVRYIKGRIHDDESAIHYILGQCRKIAFLDEKLYYYVQREGSITAKRKWIYYADTFQAYEERLCFLKENGYTQMAYFTKCHLLHFIVNHYKDIKGSPEADMVAAKMRNTIAVLVNDEDMSNHLSDSQMKEYRLFSKSPLWYTLYQKVKKCWSSMRAVLGKMKKMIK